MQKILTIDMDNTFVLWSYPNKNMHVRPYTIEFFEECKDLFDKIYLNTCETKRDAVNTLKILGLDYVRYYDWRTHSKDKYYGKINGYEQFIGNKLIHVDDSPSDIEYNRCIELEFQCLTIKPWTANQALMDKDTARNDDELLKTLERIKRIIK